MTGHHATWALKRLLPIAVLTALALLAAPALASASPLGAYRTDEQAARYVQRTHGGPAFCLNGFYSAHERRTHRHDPHPHSTVETYRTFACTLTTGATTRRLYVQTRRGPWVVIADR